MNFGIANLKRIFELTKFKNENFKICNYIFQKSTILPWFEKQIYIIKETH